MNADKPNIAQIQKYLNGELDAKAMHQLERAAQDDPFIMDALEGYQNNGKAQTANLKEIRERFAERLEKPERRSILLWRALPIAASVLIALTAGLLWYPKSKPEKPARVMATVTLNKSTVLPQNNLAKPPVSAEQFASDNLNRTSVQPNKQTAYVNKSRGKLHLNIIEKNEVYLVDNKSESISAMLANREQSLDISDVTPVVPTVNKIVTGIITDATGHGLAGVKVAIEGTQLSALTDTAGTFNITNPAQGGMLNVAYRGYKPTQVALTGKDSLKIVLNESISELAEISVPGYAEANPAGLAHPLLGWKAFKDYIRKNAHMVNGETGRVKLAFNVAANGSITGVRIIRGKNDAMNRKAIALLVGGPEWSSQGDIKEVKIKIRFRKFKNT